MGKVLTLFMGGMVTVCEENGSVGRIVALSTRASIKAEGGDENSVKKW